MSPICVLITTAKPASGTARAAHFHMVQDIACIFFEMKVETAIYCTDAFHSNKKKTIIITKPANFEQN